MAKKVRSIEEHRGDWENEEEYKETKENPFRQFPTSGSLGNCLWFLRLIRRISMLDECFTSIYDQDQKKKKGIRNVSSIFIDITKYLFVTVQKIKIIFILSIVKFHNCSIIF